MNVFKFNKEYFVDYKSRTSSYNYIKMDIMKDKYVYLIRENGETIDTIYEGNSLYDFVNLLIQKKLLYTNTTVGKFNPLDIPYINCRLRTRDGHRMCYMHYAPGTNEYHVDVFTSHQKKMTTYFAVFNDIDRAIEYLILNKVLFLKE